MTTVNGIGTGLRGWRHRADGTSTATSWLLFVYLPVLPLRRYRVRVLTDFENEPFVPKPAGGGWLSGGFSWSDPVQVLERLPFSWSEALWTYVNSYVLVPLLCLWPFGLAGLATYGHRAVQGDPEAHLPDAWVKALIALVTANMVLVLLAAARCMRGYPGSTSAQGQGNAGQSSHRSVASTRS